MPIMRGPTMKTPSSPEKVFAAWLGAGLLFLFGAGSYYLSTTMIADDGKGFFSSVGIGSMVIAVTVIVGMWLYRRFVG